jgi:hypothetical protein
MLLVLVFSGIKNLKNSQPHDTTDGNPLLFTNTTIAPTPPTTNANKIPPKTPQKHSSKLFCDRAAEPGHLSDSFFN